MDASGPCPDSALLAAFLDGELADFEREAVVAHLAECSQCRTVAMAVVEFREVQGLDALWAGSLDHQPESHEPLATREARWTRAKTRAPAGLILLALIAGLQSFPLHAPTMRVAPPRHLPPAVAAARWSDASAAPPRAAPSEPSASLRPILDRTSADDPRSPLRHSLGVEAFRSGDIDEAIAHLRIATLADPDDAGALNDLAAAYYERATHRGHAEDLPAALDAVERAVQAQPSLSQAWYNRALIVTSLGLGSDAQVAWRDYLTRDPGTAWGDDARRRLQVLAAAVDRSWSEHAAALERAPDAANAQAAVRDYPSHARDLFDRTVDAWGASLPSGDEARRRELARVLAAAFAELHGDRYFADVVTAVDEAVATSGPVVAARALRPWSTRPKPNPTTAKAALPVLRQLAPQLAPVNDALAFRAEVEHATAMYTSGSLAEAITALSTLRTRALAHGYRALATRASWITGMAEFERRDLAAARVAYEAMLADEPADVDQRVMAHVLRANVNDVLGNVRDAWADRVSAMRLLDRCQNPTVRFNALMSAAGQAKAADQLGAALLFHSRLLADHHGLDAAAESHARIQRAGILARLRRAPAARADLAQARQQLPALRDRQQRTRREADALAVESVLLQPVDAAAAFATARRAVAAAAGERDLFHRSQLYTRLAEAALQGASLAEADAAAAEAIAALDAVRAAASSGARQTSDHERTILETAALIALRRGDLPRAFAYTERRRLHVLDAAGAPPRVTRLEELQAQLAPGTALVVLNQLRDELHTWVVTSRSVAWQAEALTARDAAALALSQQQELAQAAAAAPTGGMLFDLLFKPVWRHLAGTQTLVVVADAPYDRLAMASIRDRSRDRYLIEDFRLAAAPSATTFLQARRRRPPTHDAGAIAIVNARAAGPSAPPESGEIGGLYPRAVYAAGPAATVSALRDRLSTHGVVHLAARVAGSGAEIAGTALRLTDETGRRYSGAVPVAQLAASTPVRTTLVTLSAGPVDDPTPTSGARYIAQALLASGVATVVTHVGTTSPDVDRVFVEFHRQYASGVAAAESLRRAQLAALRASNRRAGTWASLTVFGATD